MADTTLPISSSARQPPATPSHQMAIPNQPVSPQRPRDTIMDKYRLRLHSTSGKIADALEVLNLLDVLGCKDNREEFMDAMKDFLIPGNILEKYCGELCELRPSPKEMRRITDELLKMYRKEDQWQKKQMGIFIISAITSCGFIAFYCPGAYCLYPPVLYANKCVIDIKESDRKVKAEAVEKKIKGVTKVREVASSCGLIQEDLKAFSDAYKQLMEDVQHVKKQMEPTQDNQGDNTVGNELSLSKRVRDVAKKARQMKQKMLKMKEDMEKAENLVVEAISDTSFMDADEEILSERNSYNFFQIVLFYSCNSYNFFHGLMKKLFG